MRRLNFREAERRRLVAQRDTMFGDPGGGRFRNRAWDFVLKNAALNLWYEIRSEAIDYFKTHEIRWWYGVEGLPTGYLLSSQVACVNHLFPIRRSQGAATALLQGIDPEVAHAEIVEPEDGFVAFEFIGQEKRLDERAFTRGENCTSVDAAMIGRLPGGACRLFLIEWKYTEFYPRKNLYEAARWTRYDSHILHPESPFRDPESLAAGERRPDGAPNLRILYFEPFYQMMRQTLLGSLIARDAANEYACTSFRHIHVVPEDNKGFHRRVTSPPLVGAFKRIEGRDPDCITEAWRSVLKEPDHYLPRTPEDLLAPVARCPDTASHLAYLRARYWG